VKWIKKSFHDRRTENDKASIEKTNGDELSA
jgi:hypothetical protein